MNTVLAEEDKNESKYIFGIEHDSRYYQQKIDLNKLEAKERNVKKKAELQQEEYNENNFMATRIGVQQEFFEEKQGFFVESFTPAFDLIFYKKIFDNFFWTFDFQASKSNFIARQLLSYNFNIFDNYSLRPFIRLGEKVALTEQVNSGYFFFNTGTQLIAKYNKWNLMTEFYTSPAEFSKLGIYLEALYKLKFNEVGVYFGQEHYDQTELEYERQGQETTRFGFILKF